MYLSSFIRFRRLLHHHDRGNKPISPPTYGLDKLWLMRLIPERLAQLADDDGQDSFTHHGLGPDSLQKGLFRHELPGLRQQTAQDGKSFGADPYNLATFLETLISQIQEKWLKDETLMIWHTSPVVATCTMTLRPMAHTL